MAETAPTNLADTDMLLVSAVALIDCDGGVVGTTSRKQNNGWIMGISGGKIELGETPETAPIRELDEELGINTAASCLAPLTFASHSYDASDNRAAFHLLLMLYVCRRWQGRPQPLEGGTLKWVRPQQLRDYPMPAPMFR